MSARFASASSQYLVNSSPAITGYPFTVGMWVRPASIQVNGNTFSLCDTGTENHYFSIQQVNLDIWRLGAAAGGSQAAADAGAVVQNQWTFLVGRFISASSRRLSVLAHTGAVSHGSNGLSRTPTSVDTMSIGSLQKLTPSTFFNGLIAEFWYTNTDIQPDGAQLQNSTLWQLAMNGPFSLPHIAKDVIEYRSFRRGLDSRTDSHDEVYHRGTRPVWTNTNGVTLGAHPPQAANWRKPRGRRIALPAWLAGLIEAATPEPTATDVWYVIPARRRGSR